MAEIENPFSENWFSALASIKTIQLATNIDFLALSVLPLAGENISLVINAETTAAHKVFSTGSAGIPSMRSLTRDDLPDDILPSQVDGLEGTLEALVKTLISANLYLTLSSNAQGDHVLTANVGTTSNTLAAGNDTRFPASVTGLRKSAGAGSTDTAAVAKTDYWDASVFVASGASHAKGLVPDPGASAGTTKFLREDGTWQVGSGSGSVSSVGLTMPAEYSVANSPITTSGTLAVTYANQVAHAVFCGPGGGAPGVPAFRAINAGDLPLGTSGTTVAVGNDTRFPASVTGLRKGAGAGSADTAAVAKTDYWDTSVFGAAGLAHSVGLVPDPGASVGSGDRFLCEDATFRAFTVAAGGITNTMLATMPARRLKANATGATASPTDVTSLQARSASLLNIESRTSFGDADYTAVSTDRYVYSTATSFTADRRVILPAANTFNPSQTITISDDTGSIQGGFVLKVRAGGADTLQGSGLDVILQDRFSSVVLAADGLNKWSLINRTPSVNIVKISSGSTYNTPIGVKALYVEATAGGAGGAGATASAANCAAGGGGSGGGWATVWIHSPDASYAFSIGAGGAGGIAANGTGTNGGNTTFGTVLAAIGGIGGNSAGGGTAIGVAGVGGASVVAGSIGDVYTSGGDGGSAYRLSGTVGIPGHGGTSRHGGQAVGPTTQGTGRGSQAYGCGGSGAVSFSSSGLVGGAGQQGILVIYELY